MFDRLHVFSGGAAGAWRVTGMRAWRGEPLPPASHIDIGTGMAPPAALWSLRGVVSNERYVTRGEKQALAARQEPLGREQARCAALIPIRKSAAWWAMTQDERRDILEEQSRHIAIGLRYLPAVARRLHHCRDLPTGEPFDFLTWFEFAPADRPAFDELVEQLRATPEWRFVEREVDIRLERG